MNHPNNGPGLVSRLKRILHQLQCTKTCTKNVKGKAGTDLLFIAFDGSSNNCGAIFVQSKNYNTRPMD